MAKLPVEFHPEANLEKEAAFDWYAERSLQLAHSYFLALEKARVAIQDSPESWAGYLYGTRRYLLKRFPYIVVYRVTDRRIEIIAVSHTSRKPGYWKERL